jgi:hypothetical protein
MVNTLPSKVGRGAFVDGTGSPEGVCSEKSEQHTLG